jgi:hypothetical protein
MLGFVTLGDEDISHRVLGQTPRLERDDKSGRRDLEILEWCNINNYAGPWIALDDIPEVFNGHPNLYVVDGARGLTNEDVENVIAIIRSKSNR